MSSRRVRFSVKRMRWELDNKKPNENTFQNAKLKINKFALKYCLALYRAPNEDRTPDSVLTDPA